MSFSTKGGPRPATSKMDLRTNTGRAPYTRKLLKRCRRLYVEANWGLANSALLDRMRAAGYYSDRTTNQDATASIHKHRKAIEAASREENQPRGLCAD